MLATRREHASNSGRLTALRTRTKPDTLAIGRAAPYLTCRAGAGESMTRRTRRRRSPGEVWAELRTYIRSFRDLGSNARQLIIAATLLWVGIGISGVLFNLYLVGLGYNVAYVGLLAAVSTVGQAAASPLMGPLLRRWSARTVMTAATSLVALSMVLCAVATNAELLVFAVVIQGVAIAVASIPSAPFLMEHTTVEQRAHAFSAYVAATNFGSMMGSLISGLVPPVCALMLFLPRSSVPQDRLGLLLGAAVTSIGIWTLLRISKAVPAEEGNAVAVSMATADDADQDETRRDVIAMMVASALIAISLGVIYPLFNVYFATVHHASTSTIGGFYAASGVICTVAVLFGPLAARRGTLRWLIAARLLSVPMFLVLWLQPGLIVAFLAYIGRNISGQLTGVLENTYSMEAVPANLRSAVASWRTFSFNVGWTVSSLAAGVIVARFGFEPVFVAGAVFTVAGSGTWYYRFARKGSRRRFPLHAEAAHPGPE